MALSDLSKKYSILHIAGREYRVRYSLNALLCLEDCYKPIEDILKVPVPEWTIEDILQLTRAALCDTPWNKKAVVDRAWKYVQPDIAKLGKMVDIRDLKTLRNEIMNALTNSFPEPTLGEKSNGESINHLHMRALYCDVMRRPEPEFWLSNLREVKERTDAYLEVKGLKEPVQTMQMYED